MKYDANGATPSFVNRKLLPPDEVHRILGLLGSADREKLLFHIAALTSGTLDWENHGRYKIVR
jgi:hypothetical protein